MEPYVLAADIDAVAPHIGRGGWTWDTGSAGWMCRLMVELLLGLRLEVDRLHIAPCLPAHWEALTIHYPCRETVYHIVITQAAAGSGEGHDRGATLTVGGMAQDGDAITLVDDHVEHKVELWLPVA